MISYGRQSINKSDIESVVKVLKSNFLTQGPLVAKFEKDLSSFTQSKYSTVVNSGTSALHIACLALGLKKGDFLWTSSISFVASANCGLYCGAKIDLIDIDINNLNLSFDHLKKKLELAKKNKVLPKIIVPVHMSGISVDMKKLYSLSKKYKFKIVEDASHALGSKYNNKPVGCCVYSHISVFSFHPVKTITTGEGGVATTNSKLINDKLKLFRAHGIVSNNDLNLKNKKIAPWYYEQEELGFNYRMSDTSAALGISQLKRIKRFISKRKSLAMKYNNALAALPIKIFSKNEITNSSNHLYIIRVSKNENLGLYRYLEKNGIKVNLHYIPIYKHPYYKKMKFNSIEFPNAEKYYSEALSLPIYFDLSFKQQKYIVNTIKKYFKK